MRSDFQKRAAGYMAGLLLLGLMVFPLKHYYESYRVRTLIETKPEEIVASLSLEEKIGQLIHVGMEGTAPNSITIEDIQNYHVGGVILFAANLGNNDDVKRLNSTLQGLALSSSGIPLFISIDQEGGRVVRVKSETSPSAFAIGQTRDVELAHDIGFVTSFRMRGLGFNMLLAPVLDVNNNPANPVINTRSFGGDPEVVSEMGIALSKGIREAGSLPVIKHFPGHGDTNTDSHLALPRIEKTLAELEKMELIPFRRAIQQGAEAVMSAHILFRELDGENPATLSPRILNKLLRQDLSFNGIIMTDAMEMHAIAKNYTSAESAKMAFRAGADIILLTSSGRITREIHEAFLKAFKSGELSIEDLDRAVLRQIRLKYSYGHFTGSPDGRFSTEPILVDYFKENEKDRDREYQEIMKRYGAGGPAKVGSLKGIRSLGKEFAGFNPASGSKIRLFYKTQSVHDAALQRGISDQYTIRIASPGRLLNHLRSKSPDESWIVELDEGMLKEWNSLLVSENKNRIFSEEVPLIGIYGGNPFLEIGVPEHGAVLLSFSPDDISLQAALARSMDGLPVQKANMASVQESLVSKASGK